MAVSAPMLETLRRRTVRSAKVVLPVLALMLLSTMFLLARSVNPDDAIPVADVDVSERARDQQLTMPRFTGVSQDGTAFDLSATMARPAPTDPRRMSAETVRLVLDGRNGGQSTVVAASGDVDTGRRTLVLTGDVRIETSTGFRLMTDRLEGSLGRLDVASPGEVIGEGPFGRILAGQMRLDEDVDGTARLLFTGGVDLLYEPPS